MFSLTGNSLFSLCRGYPVHTCVTALGEPGAGAGQGVEATADVGFDGGEGVCTGLGQVQMGGCVKEGGLAG